MNGTRFASRSAAHRSAHAEPDVSAPDLQAPNPRLRNHVLWMPANGEEVPVDDALLARWARPGHQVLAFDLQPHEFSPTAHAWRGRQISDDPRRLADPWRLERALARAERVLVPLGRMSRQLRLDVMVPLLISAQRLRAWTGRPDWLLIDGTLELLGDPDVPPEAVNLADGGYILILRGSTPPAPTILNRCDITIRLPEDAVHS